MKDISIYFTALSQEEKYTDQKIGGVIRNYVNDSFPDLEKGGVALIYVPEFRGDSTSENEINPESFRSFFYNLNIGIDWKMPIYDLGNILPGSSIDDTYFAVAQVVAELVKKNIVPIIVGGSQDLTVAPAKTMLFI